MYVINQLIYIICIVYIYNMYSLREKMLDKQQNDASHCNYRTTVCL